MYETTGDGWDHWRTTHTRWCTIQLLMEDTDEEIHATWCTKQPLMDERNEGIAKSYEAQNNFWWMRSIKDYSYQMMRKTTVDARDRWRNPCRIIYETTVDWWGQCRNIHTRWCTKQLLMDETDEGIHSRSCTWQLLVNEANDVLCIPNDVRSNWWWTRPMKESIDDARKNI